MIFLGGGGVGAGVAGMGTGKVCWLGVVAFNHSSVSVFGCSRIEGSMGSQVLGSVFTTLVQRGGGGGGGRFTGQEIALTEGKRGSVTWS